MFIVSASGGMGNPRNAVMLATKQDTVLFRTAAELPGIFAAYYTLPSRRIVSSPPPPPPHRVAFLSEASTE
jgi:hypothetical protein